MSTVEPPVRVGSWTCCCVIVAPDGSRRPCSGATDGPDSPFCVPCETRHPGEPEEPGWIVTAVLRK